MFETYQKVKSNISLSLYVFVSLFSLFVIIMKKYLNTIQRVKKIRILGSGSSPVSWCDALERDKSVWSCMSRRRV